MSCCCWVNIRLAMVLCVLGVWCPSTAKAQKGFVSLDCGAPAGTMYNDSNTITWTSDAVAGGELARVSNVSSVVGKPPANEAQYLSSIRFFPGGQTKYCYVFNQEQYDIQPGSGYLVRASFWAGDPLPFHTQAAHLITFKLLINADLWDDVSIALPQSDVVVKELYTLAATSPPSVSVCLAGRGIGLDIPFISSLEFRALDPTLLPVYVMQSAPPGMGSRSMLNLYTINYGDSDNQIIRYPDDPYDRVWQPNTQQPSTSTTRAVNVRKVPFAIPPPQVMHTAYEQVKNMTLSFKVATGYDYFFVQHYEEISENVTRAGQRVFQVIPNGISQFLSPFYLDIFGVGGYFPLYPSILTSVDDADQLGFTLTKLPNSTYGPLISAMEILRFSDHKMSLGTLDDDVATLKDLQTKQFSSLESWSGDPCLPYAYNWLNCTSDEQPRISSLILSNKSLEGQIPSIINSLTSLVQVFLAHNKLNGSIPDLSALDNLQVLDLVDNNLSGSIPKFLVELPSLTTLLLQNNNFSGEVPSELLKKFLSPNFKFSVAGNPLLCISNNCSQIITSSTENPKKKINVALVTGLVISIALVIGAAAFGVFLFKRRNGRNPESMLSHVGKANQCHSFTYKDIRAITKNFEQKLGQGGFGPVYFGELANGHHVAVKVLSEDSHQGEREFLNEVDLLSRVHHRNLVGLLGYCTEQKLVLVYEYMPNGSLFQALHGQGTKLAAWKDRLRVAVDAAEGLEYLHKGCNPGIVHRDVKSSNILLNEHMKGKISDFGISRSKLHSSTTTKEAEMFTVVQGSYGYLDPEYAATHIVTNKIDVYAFGIVLLEIVSGRPVLTQEHNDEARHIVEWVKPLIERGDMSEVLDPSIDGDYNVSSMWKVVDVAMMCVAHDSKRRPNMSEVSLELKSALSMETPNDISDSNTFDINSSFTYTSTSLSAR